MTETAPTPEDYDSSDGWSDNDETVEVCARCDTVLGNPVFVSPVYNQSGQKFESLYATEPGTGPFFCGGCWHELEKNRKQQNHTTLTEFGSNQ